MATTGRVEFTLGDRITLEAHRAEALAVLLAAQGGHAATVAARKIRAQIEASPELRASIVLEPDEQLALLSVVNEVNPIRSVEALEPLHRALDTAGTV